MSQLPPRGKCSSGKCVAEELVIDAKVVAVDARLRGARRSSGLEDIDGLSRETLRYPALHGTAAQPFVLKESEAFQVVELLDFPSRIPVQLLCKVEPEGAARRGIEMPGDDFAHPRIQLFSMGLQHRRRPAASMKIPIFAWRRSIALR